MLFWAFLWLQNACFRRGDSHNKSVRFHRGLAFLLLLSPAAGFGVPVPPQRVKMNNPTMKPPEPVVVVTPAEPAPDPIVVILPTNVPVVTAPPTLVVLPTNVPVVTAPPIVLAPTNRFVRFPETWISL